MDKKSLKVKIFLNLFGTYKEVRQVADMSTTPGKGLGENLVFLSYLKV